MRLVAQQIVEAGLGTGLCINLLNDHGAVQAVLAIRRWQVAGNDNRTGRYATVVDFTGFAIIDLGRLADVYAHRDYTVVFNDHAFDHFRTGADEAVVANDGWVGLQRLEYAANAYAAGEVHIGWATLDMIPLFIDSFSKDSRIMPRVYQQVDFSNGGDGIVVRDSIKTVKDLAGKTLVLAQNSPSQFFALNMLVAGGLQPADVQMRYVNTAFEAAAAFDQDKSIAGCVSWAPDIYNLAKAKGNRMLVTTQTANRLIADVWFARADFAKDHPDKIEAIVRGIFDGMQELKSESARAKVATLMADGYNIPAADALGMLGDAHSTNWAENYQFFVNRNNPANFERIWKQSSYLYRRIGALSNAAVPFDQVMDFSVIQKLGAEPKYAETKDEYLTTLAPKSVQQIRAENEEILTNTIVVHFFPNSSDLRKKVIRRIDGREVEEPYDPTIDLVLDEAGLLAKQFGNARIVVEGHTDASMKGAVPAAMVRELSLERAKAVKDALVGKFKFDDNRFAVDGLGWDRPADHDNPDNHALNRRVEIKVYSAEKE